MQPSSNRCHTWLRNRIPSKQSANWQYVVGASLNFVPPTTAIPGYAIGHLVNGHLPGSVSLVHRSSNYCHTLLRNRTSKRSANWQCVVGAAFRQPLPYLVTQWAPRKRSTKWQFVVGASVLQRVPYLVTLVHPSSNDCQTWLRCRNFENGSLSLVLKWQKVCSHTDHSN